MINQSSIVLILLENWVNKINYNTLVQSKFMKQYKIVTNAQPTVVELEVAKLLSEGWLLAGGISSANKHEHGSQGEHIPGHLVYSQALIKEID